MLCSRCSEPKTKAVLFKAALCVLLSLLLALAIPVGASASQGSDAASSKHEATMTLQGSSKKLFKKMAGDYSFSSGVGAWGTSLKVYKNGKFKGTFHDMNMGETGPGYPHGSVYICEFSGKFKSVKKLGAHKWSAKVASLKMKKKPNRTYIKDQIRYTTTTPYGMPKNSKVIIFEPGMKVSKMPKAATSWVYGISNWGSTLPYWCIYNVKDMAGFYKYN